ncbi:MAG TPA: ADOP family duplicated permease, partial [Vicinamibacterales bacterium]|nr:ADOP family duplicated permease [Vicinamibacterales bacterium]
DAADIAEASRTLEHSSLAADQSSILREGTPRRVSGRRVERSFFEIMRVPAARGRVLGPEDGENGIVLGDDLWRTVFAADPAIVGRTIALDGGFVAVVGVMPPRFDADADFWVSLGTPRGAFARDDRQFTMFARLAPGASLGTAATELMEISRRLGEQWPATNRDWVTVPVALRRMHGRDSRSAFLMLQGAVAIVLLIACANIANILLARGTRRRREVALRLMLGAGRGRLVRGLLLESAVLSAAGAVLGVLLSMGGIRLARAIGGFPEAIDPRLNAAVLAFSGFAAGLTAILCGVLPAQRASRVAPETVLRSDDGRIAPAQSRLRSGLVIAQIACALVLAACAMLMVRTLANRQRVDLGFSPRNAVRAEVVLPADRYEDPESLRIAGERILERLGAEPDVAAAGLSTWALPTGAGGLRHLTLPGSRDVALNPGVRRGIEAVTAGYFQALGAPVISGRAFTDADRAGSLPVAIVNQELARHLWPGRSPVGERIRLGLPSEDAPIVTVVGLAGTIRRSAMHDVPVARVYVPFAQHPNGNLTLLVRGRVSAAAAGRALDSAVRAADSLLLVEGQRTLEADLAQFTAPVRLITWLLAAFGVAGLALAALGVFGTMSYVVSLREREMAVRSALGAASQDIVRLVLGSALKLTGAGVALGGLGTLVATRVLSVHLFGVSPTDPLTLLTVAGFLTIVAIAACYRPARVASRTDPMALLRQ